MRMGITVIVAGAVMMTFGILFFLQGNSIVGPTSSFMYSNPKWITYGESIAVIGVAIIVMGIVTSLRRPRS